jgi:hypothetical protein
MLDVHPPHEAAHTWKDFFIHIATIVVGLLIAVSLEQTVELLHHREQRSQLLEDLRQEAEVRIRAIDNNNRVHAVDEKWYRDTLQAALKAEPLGGFVTFVVPAEPPQGNDPKPECAVWDAAKASGLVSVLRRGEIEAWNRDNLFAELNQKRVETWNADSRALRATADHLGVVIQPGATIHITLGGRDELTRALGNVIEDAHSVILGDADNAGSSDAALHGAQTAEQMAPYIRAARQSLPK